MQTQSNTFAEMKQTLIDSLNDLKGYYTSEVGGLHHELCNTDYYIVGPYQAKKALEDYGVFEAIELVKDYELSYFVQVMTDFSNPEKLVNMLYFVIGENLLFSTKAYQKLDGDEKCTDDAINNIIEDLERI